MARGREGRAALCGRALALTLALAGCGGSNAASVAARPPELPSELGQRCKVAKSASEPLVIEWPSEARGKLESLERRGLVAIRYDGCEVEVLAACSARDKRGYAYVPLTRKETRLAIKNEDELYASLPIGALGLEGKLKAAGELDVDMTLVGRWEADRAELARDELEGRCDGATHVVAAFTVGAFTFTAGAEADAGGKVGVGAVAGGAASRAKKETLSRDGDAGACARSTGTDTRPPDQCGAMIRIEVIPIRARAAVATVVTPPHVAPKEETELPPSEPAPKPEPHAAPPRVIEPPAPAPEPTARPTFGPTTSNLPEARSPTALDVAAGLAIAQGASAGLILAMQALHYRDEAKKDCIDAYQVCGPKYASDVSTAHTLAWLANVSLGLGALGLGVGFYRLATRAKHETTISIAPGAASVRGSF